jgi:hypothetical protein
MAMDYTKYDLRLLLNEPKSVNNLNKRKLSFEVIKYLLENNLVTTEVINELKFNNKLIVASQEDYNNFSEDKKKRFFQTDINGTPTYISNQWGKPGVERLIDYIERQHSPSIEIDEQSSIDEDDLDEEESISFRKHPLNQIFYGPPGTGKTHNAIPEAEKIIHNNLIGSGEFNNIKDDFERIIRYIRKEFILADHNVINGKSFYRDLKSIFFLWGHILDAEFAGEATLTSEMLNISATYWPMNYRIVTHWGVVDDWQAKSITLNQEGIEFKNKIKLWLSENPNFYQNLIPDFDFSNLSPEEILTKKVISF